MRENRPDPGNRTRRQLIDVRIDDPDLELVAAAVEQGHPQPRHGAGGIGMTMEYKAGHYFKRLTMIDTMFGDADYHLRMLARDGRPVAA